MCPFVGKKKEKSVVFSLTYKYYETAYTIFSTLSNLPYYSSPPIINNYYNVQPRPIIPTPPIIQDSRVTEQYLKTEEYLNTYDGKLSERN